MLNRHSKVVVPPECGYMTWYMEAYAGRDFGSHETRATFVEDVLKAKKFETWKIERDGLIQFINERAPSSYAEAIYPRRYFYSSLSRVAEVASEISDCPISDDISCRILCLPLSARMMDESIDAVCSALCN